MLVWGSIMKCITVVVLGLMLLSLGLFAYSDNLNTAEAFIDAFYSYDQTLLSNKMDAGDEGERMIYYQAWAEAANYQVKNRRLCSEENDHVVCKITVTDDFGRILGYTATDTFTLAIENDLVVSAESQGDDPPIFMELFGWISKNRPEVLTGPCADMFEGGRTPADCARSVVQAASQFIELRGSND